MSKLGLREYHLPRLNSIKDSMSMVCSFSGFVGKSFKKKNALEGYRDGFLNFWKSEHVLGWQIGLECQL